MTVKQFFSMQKEFFVDVGRGYLAPFRFVVGTVGVLVEMFKHAFISFTMNSEEFQKLQDIKFQEETDLLCQRQEELDKEQQ